jgi:ABC-type transport system involved in multi-copper enzyme maturation permease subunit
MTGTIARRELVDAVITGRAALLFVIAMAVLGTGMLALSRDYHARLEAHALIRPDGTEPMLTTAPSPLSVFARGLDDVMGRGYEVNPGMINVRQTQAAANPLFAVFRTPDWLFVFRVVIGLLAFLAAYDLICREKAQGTLKLLLSGGASRAQVAAGKWLGAWLAFAVPVLLAALLWLALARPLFGLELRPGDGAAVTAFLFSAFAYLAVCFTIAAALSALFHDQTTALVSAVLAWVVIVFVVPGAGTLAARQVVPLRPLALVQAERNEAFGRGMILSMDSLAAAQSASEDERFEVLYRGWGRVHADHDRISERRAAESARLATVAESFIRISPAGAFDGIATRLLGTSLHDEALLRQRMLQQKNAMLPDVFRGFTDRGDVAYAAFVAPQLPLGAALASRIADVVALAVVAMLALLVYFNAVRGYDVR